MDDAVKEFVVSPRCTVDAAEFAALQSHLKDHYTAAWPADPAAGLAAWALAALQEEAWRPASAPPQALAGHQELAVTVQAVIDDPRFQVNGEQPFVDTAAWWPARGLWTVTHQCRADEEVTDYPVKVRCWRPLKALPPAWSDLWRAQL